MDELEKMLLMQVADLHKVPEGAYNIRKDGETDGRKSTANIEIVPRKDGKSGIDIIVRPFTKNESVHIPVVITKTGLQETVYNDFYIGEGADVLIIAGCGIHNCGEQQSEHSGVHSFHVGKGAKVRYVEKHYAEGDGRGENVMNPTTRVEIEEGGRMEMETTQIKGVDSTLRETDIEMGAGAKLYVMEKLMTHDEQTAESNMEVRLNGEGSSAQIISRSVAKGTSRQVFHPKAVGNNKCHAHIQCDSIIMDHAKISSIPAIEANDADAQVVHEAAIGRINNDQLLKLMTFGMSEEEAEEVIIEGFLK